MRKIYVFLLSFLIFTGACFADESIKAEVDKLKVVIGEVFTYKITVSLSQGQITAPKLPELKDFQVVSQAQSSQISFSGGSAKTAVVYAFVLSPINTGKFTIGPATIKIKDKDYVTSSFIIEVIESKGRPKEGRKAPSMPRQKRIPYPETEEPKPQITL